MLKHPEHHRHHEQLRHHDHLCQDVSGFFIKFDLMFSNYIIPTDIIFYQNRNRHCMLLDLKNDTLT